MATKLYLNNVTGKITPTAQGAWDDTASVVTIGLNTDKAQGGAFTGASVAETSATDEYDVLMIRAVSPKLDAQTIDGTVDVVLAVLESAAAANLHWHLHIWVSQGDTATPRGTLLTDYRESAGVNEWPTAESGIALNAAQTLSSVAASAGDRIVVELGYAARNTSTTSMYGVIAYGGGESSTDLVVGDGVGVAFTRAGFLTFSDTITFQATTARVTQVAEEVLALPAAATARVTQVAAEALVLEERHVLITQVALEVLVQEPVVTTMPRVLVEIAFANNPGDVVLQWTDVSAYAEMVATRRGRQDELGRVEAGTATIVLSNEDGRFLPDYAGGPYYPRVTTGKRVRVRATFDGVTNYILFTGFIDDWRTEWPDSYHRTRATITATDGTKFLALAGVTGTFPQQRSDERARAILDQVSWAGPSSTVWVLDTGVLDTSTILGPVGDALVGAGLSTVQAATLAASAGDTAWGHLQKVDETEAGLMYINPQGQLVFVGRGDLLTAPAYTTVQATFGDDGAAGELPYKSFDYDHGDTRLWNQVTVTREGGVAQVANDATSQLQQFTRTLPKTGLLMTSDSEALNLAEWLVALYKNARTRITSLVLEGFGDPVTGHWPQMLGRDIGDRVRVLRRMGWVPVTLDQTLVIQGVEHTYSREQPWVTRWSLAPATDSIIGDFWQLDVSVLDTDTRLAY